MAKLENDKYYTEDSLAKYCVETTFAILGNEWERIIEPSAGNGSFLKYLPPTTLAFDIAPEAPNILRQDYRLVVLPHCERSLVIGNPPFGRSMNLLVQFMIASLKHSDYISFIAPISQLDNNRKMTNTKIVYSENLGILNFSGKQIHCCLNIYQKSIGGHKCDYTIPGIFSTAISSPIHTRSEVWDYRTSAWGTLRLLNETEHYAKENVFRVEDEAKREWLGRKLAECDFHGIINNYISMPSLPLWRLNKWLKEQWEEDTHNEGED